MRSRDLFLETFSALLSNKVRSGLTTLGIIIGIGSVIAMVSIGEGAQKSIESSIQSIGSNLLIVYPGAQGGSSGQVRSSRGSAQTLKLEDAIAIQEENTGLISFVAPEQNQRLQITAKGTNSNTSVVGVTPPYASVRSIKIQDGGFITEQHNKSLAKVAVIGPTTRDDLFGVNTNPVGQTIRIKQIEFRVIGVSQSKGGSGFGSSDDIIYVPLSTSQHFLSGSEWLTSMSIQVKDQDSMTQAQADITALLLKNHKIDDPQLADFSVFNQADIAATASSITGTFTLLLGAIAGISLLVGGIGIMNMMLTTVTERTREIGLRKAIGAKPKDIYMQFLLEAILLTSIGGVFGILLGYLLSLLVGNFGITASLSISSIIMAFGVSASIGIIFGFSPARRAAKLKPIEALRYE